MTGGLYEADADTREPVRGEVDGSLTQLLG